MSIGATGAFYPGCECPCCPHPPHVGPWRAQGRQLRAAPLGSAHGTGVPRTDPLSSCPPADPSATVEDLRHAIITNLEQSREAWPPACPPLEPARWEWRGGGWCDGGAAVAAPIPQRASFWGKSEPKRSTEQLLHHPSPRRCRSTAKAGAVYVAWLRWAMLLHLLMNPLISLN